MPIEPPGSVAREHLHIEAMKLARADRDEHLTDPDHMKVDAHDLVAPDRLRARAALVDPERAAGRRPGRASPGGTIYLCAADRDGMCVSLIQSNYMGFGSGLTVPGWGINLQNRGADFLLDDTHVNVIAPRKRPRHTLMPAMAFRDGWPWLVFGTMGGDGQAQTHVQVLTKIVDDGCDIEDAVDAPRWAVSPEDFSVLVESRFAPETVAGLRERGHVIVETGRYDAAMGHAHAILVGSDGYQATSDPRSEGAALGL
jgi:gamma-glutamyltranspeptidase/glutathione hydrolase